MKKYFLFISISVLSSVIWAQGDRSVYFNPKVGLNLSGLNDQPEGVSTSNKLGYNAGLDLRIGEGTVFLQPGIFYYQFNREYSVVSTGSSSSASTKDIKVESIKVPVNIGFRIIETKPLSIRFNLGPAFSFPVTVTQYEDNFDIARDNHKNVSIGGVVGAGVDLSLLTLDLNYEFGLSDFIDFTGQNISSGTSKQYVISFCVGIRI